MKLANKRSTFFFNNFIQKASCQHDACQSRSVLVCVMSLLWPMLAARAYGVGAQLSLLTSNFNFLTVEVSLWFWLVFGKLWSLLLTDRSCFSSKIWSFWNSVLCLADSHTKCLYSCQTLLTEIHMIHTCNWLLTCACLCNCVCSQYSVFIFSAQWLYVSRFHCAIFHGATDEQIKAPPAPTPTTHTHTEDTFTHREDWWPWALLCKWQVPSITGRQGLVKWLRS